VSLKEGFVDSDMRKAATILKASNWDTGVRLEPYDGICGESQYCGNRRRLMSGSLGVALTRRGVRSPFLVLAANSL